MCICKYVWVCIIRGNETKQKKTIPEFYEEKKFFFFFKRREKWTAKTEKSPLHGRIMIPQV